MTLSDEAATAVACAIGTDAQEVARRMAYPAFDETAVHLPSLSHQTKPSSEGSVASLVGDIAIVGLAFRLPGDLRDEQSFWQALKEGRDLVRGIGRDRWATSTLQHPKRSEPGRSVTFSAGVLSRVDEFDATFFGISPREAALMDPQQRLLLELAWEALENGGIKPSSLAGSDCAVYVGISGLDYGMRALDDLSAMAMHSMTGNTLSIAANRLSYVFDLHGPSMAVDTACSSSLVALHEACQCLASGRSPAAIVGGVNLLLHPYPFVGFTKASMLSAEGRCRAFAEGGDGYVRAEGGAVLVLKPLARAEADGDRIYGVIRGTGVNADGRRKSGLTIPSVEGQIELMRQVCERAGIPPQEVDYVEAHGTGTQVGDPIEARAIGTVFGQCRQVNEPLPIGSVKSNLGHMEPASGMAGLTKALLVLEHKEIPPSVHSETLNAQIDFAGLRLEVVRSPKPLPQRDRPLRVAVNSFGFGGANAHVLLEEYRPRRTGQTTATAPRLPVPLVFSARSDEALKALAGRYAELLQEGVDPCDVAHAAWHRRDWLEERAALLNVHAADAGDALTSFAVGADTPAIVRETAMPEDGKLAFVYSGNGAQWAGMGRALMRESPEFARLLEEVDALMRPRVGFSVIDVLGVDDPAVFDDTAVAQPALFAIQVALTQLLRTLGLDADAATGHSVGEIAAAWAAGVLSLEDAVHVMVARSQAQAATRGSGRMAAVGLGVTAMRDVLHDMGLVDEIEIAGENSPNNVTLSGPLKALQAIEVRLREGGVFFRFLDLDYAFHSRAMEPVRERLLDDLADLEPSAGSGRFFSTVTGSLLEGSGLDAAYWWRNVREPVRFGPAIQALAAEGYRVFLEIGPHAILQRYVSDALNAAGVQGRALAALRRDDDRLQKVQEVVLRAALLRVPVDAKAYFPHSPKQWVRLPNYPWQRSRYWLEATPEAYRLIERHRVHPLLGYRLKEPAAAWENHLDPQTLPYLTDHKVGGAMVLAGAAYVEMALAVSREWFGGEACAIEEIDILAPVVFDGEHARTLRFSFDPQLLRFRIEGRQRLSDDPWTLHAVGRLLGAPTRQRPNSPAIVFPEDAPVTRIDAEAHYALATRLGLDYGLRFRGIRALTVASNVLLGELQWPQDVYPFDDRHLLHPAVLDQCFQAVLGWFQRELGAYQGLTFLPVKVGHLQFWGSSGSPMTQLRAKLIRRSPRSVLVDFELLDAECRLVAEVRGCRFRAAMIQTGERLPALWVIRQRLQDRAQRTSPLASGPTSRQLIEALRRGFAEQERDARKRYFGEIAPLIEILPLAFARDAMVSLQPQALHRGIPDAVVESWRNAHPLADRLIAALEDEGILTRQGEIWRLLDEEELPPAQTLWRAVLGDCPETSPELLLMGRVGRCLPTIFKGEAMVLAPGDTALTEQLFDQAPAYAATHRAIALALEDLLHHWPADRRVRILEFSGGGKNLPEALLPILPAGRFDYVIAEADPQRLSRLQADYAEEDDIRVVAVDGETLAFEDQSGLPHGFDIVILRHGLHRLREPVAALATLARSVSPGGVLLLVERHPDRATDLMFGSEGAWWHRGLDGKPHSSLLAPAGWRRVLEGLGWQDIEAWEEPAAQGLALGSYLVVARWAEKKAQDSTIASAAWALIGGQTRHAEWLQALGRRLESLGQQVRVAFIGVDVGACEHVVFLSPLADQADTREIAQTCNQLRALLTAAAQRPVPPRVWVLTRGGMLAEARGDEATISLANAALWGMARVAMNEYPQLQLTLIDLQGDLAQPALHDALEHELLHPDGEREIVLSAQGRFVPRMQRLLLENEPKASFGVSQSPVNAATVNAWRLDFTLPGQLKNLHWRAVERPFLGEDEIEIEACAAGLNFRDVMYAMGLLSDEALENGFAGPTLGLEVAGRVSHCGPRVSRFKVGDEVVAFAGGSFASHVVVAEWAAAHKPAEWSFSAAATIPTVFFTVWYALKHLAQLQAGERVLIHGAAGGVGLAAIQVARHLGAEIFATAGSAEKRDFVALLGADHVLDSRSLGFADEILHLTQGEGVDVVLNSLAGEAINRNLRVLKPFGRFLELGKRDFYENTPIGLRPFKDNLSYFGIDADQFMKLKPRDAARIFREVMALLIDGVLRPLPHRVFPVDRVVDAFRHMQQARQIGKVVIDLSTPPRHITDQADLDALRLKPDATYLVTGGLSGFGLASARWLAGKGAGHLILLGRRGWDTPGAQEAVQSLEALGAKVHVHACDVSDRAQLAQLLDAVQNTCPPLRGVLHAAMVLDDALLANLDAERFERVLMPKLAGAWHLHELTLGLPLGFFILYSSATTFIGNPGQANYAAANAGLEALARLRRQMGLPATVVAWGAIGDVGVLTRSELAREGLQARLGAAALSSAQALGLLERLLLEDASDVAVMDMDWKAIERLLPSASLPRFEWLRRHLGKGPGSESKLDIRVLIAGRNPEEVQEILREALAASVAEILRLPMDRLDPTRSLHDLGMDSLMAVELALAVEKRFGVQLPPMAISENPSIARLAERMAATLCGTGEDDADGTLILVAAMAAQHAEDVQAIPLDEFAREVRNKAKQGTRLIR